MIILPRVYANAEINILLYRISEFDFHEIKYTSIKFN